MTFNFFNETINLRVLFKNRSAIQFSNAAYNYCELIDRAIDLSAFMSQFHSDHSVCAILSEKSIEFYQGMLACFFAGLIYMPINITASIERNKKILSIANPSVFVVGKIDLNTLMSLLSDHSKKTIIMCDYALYIDLLLRDTRNCIFYYKFTDHYSIESEINKIVTRYNENNYAYLFFTSGSTGAPKGVPISYKNLNAYLYAIKSLFSFDQEDRFIQLSDIAFDISLHEIMVCFLSGSTLYVYDSHTELCAARFIDDHKITQCFLVPSSMIDFISQSHYFKCDLSSLKTTLVCGESFPMSFARSWKIIAPNSMIANLYGPTEATIACTYHIFDEHNDYQDFLTVPIGFAFPQTHLDITPENELLITGPQVSDGYWLESDSRGCFEWNDLLKMNSYLTGDIVSWDSRFGHIFLGRKDDQWQIQGYRVEKIEIESVLRSVCKIDEIYIAAEHDKNGLVNCVIAYSPHCFVPSHYFRELSRFLPECAIPKKCIQIQSVPKLSNGKINYHALKNCEVLSC